MLRYDELAAHRLLHGEVRLVGPAADLLDEQHPGGRRDVGCVVRGPPVDELLDLLDGAVAEAPLLEHLEVPRGDVLGAESR